MKSFSSNLDLTSDGNPVFNKKWEKRLSLITLYVRWDSLYKENNIISSRIQQTNIEQSIQTMRVADVYTFGFYKKQPNRTESAKNTIPKKSHKLWQLFDNHTLIRYEGFFGFDFDFFNVDC